MEGNKAFVRYLVEIIEEEYIHSSIGLEENGEGGDAEVDRHTYIYTAPAEYDISCEYFTENIKGLSGFPVEWIRGNVQVQ